MKQIVFFTGAMGRGGAERVISLLSRHYAQKNWRVRIVQLLHSDVGYELDPRVEILDFSNDRIKAVLDMPRLITKVRKFVRAQKPDAVVAFMAPICLIVGLACWKLKTRLILSERNDPVADPRNPVFRKVLEKLYARADAVVMQTKRARSSFPKDVQKNSVIIPNPIHVYAHAVPEKKKRIVTMGRLDPQKNQKMLINAFAALHNKYPEYTLDIYGEGALQQTLQEQIDSLGMGKVITLQGNVPDVHEQIKDAAFFVLPSDYEGLSNALLEAMMMGLPCISTNCAGSDEVICHDENGLLTPVGDKDAFVAAMKKMITYQDMAEKLGQAAKADAAQFEVEKVIARWCQTIEVQ